ncbi:hypothetical protein PTSG_07255 [Salpingoeca rosetta]|uniref:Uncharacterized protein n=1 Tax=Salpingoeca rosetta (strain ATCC 50818 / BSB-021) TaxID=946362 RepID=F2UEI0_SALR5|nr:uncharacterized protein PTSG_07255 [Salpingoeca rosetta]EGD75030.1 hypothetical protein PTSG_07255 [Salpingoeca rosetta]|eukprot:XP_004992674.1 hypothetical protein PTSG_07255 [Salpingoeca rosetta]
MWRRVGSFRSSSNKGTPTTKRRGTSKGRKPSKSGKGGRVSDDEDSDWASAPITLNLGNCSLTYDNGKWQGELKEGKTRDKEDKDAHDASDPATKEHIRKLEEENRLLKFKVEVLVDMLTLARAEAENRR